MEKKWTPGPWRIERYKEPYTSFLEDINIVADGLILAKLGKELSSEHTANAHLIAASPKLYEALEELRLAVIYSDNVASIFIEDAEEALAKARGETRERGE